MEDLENFFISLGITNVNVREIMLPGVERISVQEKLLEIFEPGVLNDPDLNLPGTSQVSRLLNIYNDLGVPCSADIILGQCSQSLSINLLTNLCNLLRSPSVALNKSEELLTYIAKNPSIFQKDISLFPPTFPAKYNFNANILQDMRQIQEYWTQEYSRLESLNAGRESQSGLPTSEDITELKQAIEDFCKETRNFRKVYEETLQQHLGEASEDNKNIGKWAKSCMASYSKLQLLFQGIESIWSSINILIT